MQLVLYTSAFCAPCHAARATLAEAERLVPGARVVERDVVRQENLAAADGIRSTPTVIVKRADGAEVFRAAGAPTLRQVLAALSRALPRETPATEPEAGPHRTASGAHDARAGASGSHRRR
ncbi:thioredoxin family protein [Okibacterium endophyticum]